MEDSSCAIDDAAAPVNLILSCTVADSIMTRLGAFEILSDIPATVSFTNSVTLFFGDSCIEGHTLLWRHFVLLREGGNLELKTSMVLPDVALKLLDREVWMQFNNCENEMIITKNGRCLFPLLRFKVSCTAEGEKDEYHLKFTVRIERCDSYKWKFRNNKWVRYKLDDEKDTESLHFYTPDIHTGSAAFWNLSELSFSKLKLTNRSSKGVKAPSNYFRVSSFRKYRPVVYCSWIDGRNQIVKTGRFDSIETEFIAVTHYQSERVTELKKNFNPHAKGFLPTVQRDENQSEEKAIISNVEELTAVWILSNMNERDRNENK